MDKIKIINNLDILTKLLNIPLDVIDEKCRYDKNDIYFFPQKTEEIFAVLINDIQKYYDKKPNYIKSIIHINNNDFYKLFEDIKNPVLMYEVYGLWGNRKCREDMSELFTYLFMWDYENENENKIFYLYSDFICPYHRLDYSYLWIQSHDDFLKECNGKKLENGYDIKSEGIDNIIKRFDSIKYI